MKVVIMRHGAAAPASFGPDAHRHLTASGRQQAERTAEAMARASWTPTHLYTSPLVRAVQTAERVATVIAHPGPIVTEAALVPGGSARQSFAVLEHHGADDVILFVSHEPTVRALVGHLLNEGVGGFGTGEARGLSLVDTVTLDVTFTP